MPSMKVGRCQTSIIWFTYESKFKLYKNKKLDVKLSILNLFDKVYISDAQNNDPYNTNYQDFDSK